MNKLAAGLVAVCARAAQTRMATSNEIIGASRDVTSQMVSPIEAALFNVGHDEGKAARPSVDSVSVARLQHQVPKAAKRSMARAEKLAHADDHSSAASALEVAIRLDPAFALAYHRLGVG